MEIVDILLPEMTKQDRAKVAQLIMKRRLEMSAHTIRKIALELKVKRA